MATTSIPYRKFLERLLKSSEIDFSNSPTLKITLHTSDYTPNRDTHAVWNDTKTGGGGASTEVASGGGYTTGGVTLTTVVVGLDDDGHFAYVDADNPNWPLANFTCRYAVLRDASTGDLAVDKLIAYWDFGADQSPTTGFTLDIPTTANGGLIKVG